MRGATYIVIVDNMDPTAEFGEALSGSMAAASNFKKAYELALSMGEIPDPDLKYKTALGRCNEKRAVIVQSTAGPQQSTIVQVKKY